MRKKLLFLSIIFLFSFAGFAQNFSNKGKDFWVAYGYHQVMTTGNSQDMVLYFATDQLTTVTVSIPGLGYTQTYPNIPANTIFTTPVLPKAGLTDARLLTEGLSSKGIHIVSTKSIVAYAHIYNASVSGACVLLPTPTLGKEYNSINYTNNSNTPNANSWFYVVAADTGTTTVEIIPSANTTNGWIAGSTHTVSLTQGQVFNVMGSLLLNTGCGGNNQLPCSGVDLTGSKIKSVASGTGGCKKIAVYSGSGRISLTCNNTPSSSDNYMVQAFPKAAWGKRFLTIPTFGTVAAPPTNTPIRMPNNIYRVCVSDPAAIVKINGVITTLPLINNFYYEIPFTNTPQKIEADLPITVAQYVPSQNACGNGNPGDPEVIYLSPVEQSISNVLFNSNLLVAANPTHYVNVVIPNGGTALTSFRRDGLVVAPASFTVHPQDAAYSYIKIAGLNLGQHTLVSDSGFNAIAYGFASAESYGYNAGTNVRDFNQNLEIQSLYGIINEPSTCLNSPFTFRIYLPDSVLSNSGPTAGTNLPVRFDSMRWEVSNATAFTPNNFPVRILGNTLFPPLTGLKVAPDSLRIRNGKSVAWYSIPTPYAISTPGTYTITVTGYRTSTNVDGCNTGNETEYEFDLIASSPPLPTFTYNQPGCPADSIRFLETTPQGPTPNFYPTYRFWWSFFDPVTNTTVISTVRNPVHAFTTPGVKTIRFSNITTPGCLSDTITQFITVPALVNATIAGTINLCQNATQPTVTFTATPGFPPYTFTYNINGGASQTISTIGTNTSVTLTAPTGAVGTFAYNLIRVENANPAFCNRIITGQTATVVINPLPTATITGANIVCQNSSPPTITFTGANATAPYTFNYNINGGVNQIVTTTTGNSVTITAPTNTVGIYSYNLVSVTDASSTLCSTSSFGNIIIQVQAQPNATIAGTVSLCQDAAAPNITFNGINGNAPFTFTYNINGGAIQTVSTSATSNSVTVPVSMVASGTFVYNLLSVQNTGPTTCITPFTNASATVIINPVPTATITGSTAVCQVAGPQTLLLTGVGGTRPYTFTYSINGVTQPAVVSDAGVDTKSVIVPVTTIGSFVYKIISIRDASSTLCIRNYPLATQPTATVDVQATSTATIAGNTTVCQNSPAPSITFTGSNGTRPFTFTYNINGGATLSISTSATSNSVTVPVSMAATGAFTYNLLSVRNTGALNCTTPITNTSVLVTINPVPTATIGGTTTVCQNAATPLVTFTGFNGTAPYTFNYTLNTVPQTITTTSGNSVTLNAPTGTFGVFNYVLTSVRDASSTLCTQNQTGTATITVRQLATATIAVNVPTVCQNSTTAPFITLTANGGVAPYTFTYKINGGANLTVTTTFGSSINVPVPTGTAGTYIYTLVSVQESSSVACVNAQTGSTQVIVHPQPTASFTNTAPFCALKDLTFTPSSSITGGSITSWVWNYDNGAGPQIRIDNNPFTINYATAGVKNVTFKTVSDRGCESVLFTTPVTINVKPKAGFLSPESCLADAFAQFTDSSKPAGTIALWEWNFGDPASPTNIISGSGPTFQNPQHAYLTTGLKTVSLIVTTISGCKDTVPAQSFFINGEVTSADFIPQNGGAFCSNRPVQIRENSVVNVGGLIRVEVYWDNVGAPTVIETDELPTPGKIYTHVYPNLQVDRTYQVRYIAYTGFDGTCQKEVIKPIVVRASPVATFAPVQDVCLNGGPVVLNQGGATGGTAVYTGPGVTFAGGVYTFNPLAAGVVVGTNNNVTYTVTSPANCDSALVRQVKVLAPPVVNTFITVGNKCRINNITFRNTTTNGDGTIVRWIYNWGDGSLPQVMTTGADVTHQYATAGIKTATLTLETGYGCKNIAFPLTFTVNPLPVPSYTTSPSACLPSANVVFTNTTVAPLSNYTFNWSFELPSTSAGNTSTAPNPSHTYTTQGPHNTHLIATIIATGCKDSTLVIPIGSSIIHPAPVLRFDPIADVCLNNGNESFLNLVSETSGIAGGPGVFTGNGIISANGDFNPILAGVGTHTITYTWTSSFGCPTSITRQVKVLAAPVVNTFTISGNKCERNKIVFQNTTTQGDGAIASWVYVWDDGMTDILTSGNDTTHTYTLPQTYIATLQLITDYGCKSSPPKPVTVVVNALPKPDFNFTPVACLPQAKIDFTNATPPQSTGSLAYNWVFDDAPPTVKTTVNTDFTYYALGSHPVKLIATNTTTFCKDSLTKDIMNSLHPAPTASFNFNKPSVCIRDNVTVLDGPSNPADGTMTNWEWNYGDNGAIFTGQIQMPYTYGAAGTYPVKLKVTNSFGCVDDTTKSFTVHPYPVVNAGRDSIILEGGQIVLTPTITGDDLRYLWTGNPAPLRLSNDTIRNPIASPIADITYLLKVTSRGGCSDTNSVFIKVLKFPLIPNTFTPNNDGVHDRWVIKYLESYPDARVQVFTRTGQLVFESRRYTMPWDGTMNGKSLPFDTYYYIIEPGTGRTPLTGYVTIVK